MPKNLHKNEFYNFFDQHTNNYLDFAFDQNKERFLRKILLVNIKFQNILNTKLNIKQKNQINKINLPPTISGF